MESQMVQNSRNKIFLTFNKFAIKVKRNFHQAQQNHLTFNAFSIKDKTFRFKVNKKTSSLSTNFLSGARHIWVKLKRLLELLSKKNFSQFQASFHINPKFPVTFQQLDLSRSSRQWRDAQRSEISASGMSTTMLTTVNWAKYKEFWFFIMCHLFSISLGLSGHSLLNIGWTSQFPVQVYSLNTWKVFLIKKTNRTYWHRINLSIAF